MSRFPPLSPQNFGEPEESDSAPVEGSRDDALSFDALYRRYARRVATVGMRIMGRTNELEDFVQDVFIEVHRGLPSLREPAAAKAWIDRIAVRRAVRRVRSARFRAFVGLEEDPSELQLADTGASPEDRVLLHQMIGRLQAFPARARACWTLRKVDGYALRAVATTVGCSLATAKRDVARVDEALRKEQLQ